MRKTVFSETAQITETLGFYPIQATSPLLTEMQLFSFAILFISLVFNILVILFIAISVLLIYSLLMITTETKTFDIGVMRLVGLSSSGFVAMIFTQGVMFVLPSILVAYIAAYPSLYFILGWMFKGDLSKGGATIVPGAVATIEAIAIGLVIPTLSSIIPIQRALSKTLSESLNTARATLSGNVVIIEDKNVRAIPYIVMGLLCVGSGTIIYVALP